MARFWAPETLQVKEVPQEDGPHPASPERGWLGCNMGQRRSRRIPTKSSPFVGSNGSHRSRTEILFNKKKGPKLDLLVWRSLKIWMFYSNFKKHTQFDTQNQWDEISMAICWFPNLNYAHFKICLADSTKNSPVWVDWACYQLRRCRIM